MRTSAGAGRPGTLQLHVSVGLPLVVLGIQSWTPERGAVHQRIQSSTRDLPSLDNSLREERLDIWTSVAGGDRRTGWWRSAVFGPGISQPRQLLELRGKTLGAPEMLKVEILSGDGAVTYSRPGQLVFPPASLLLQLVNDDLRPHLLADDQESLLPTRGLVVCSPAHQTVLLGNNSDLLPLIVEKLR